jgi:hypothetical protein
MRKKRVMIMIDQASRDAFSQLLVARYVERKGVQVLLCNQHTFVPMFERYRPDVVYASWHVGGTLMDYLVQNHRRTRIALIDQEGGRIGEEPFKRSFKFRNGIKSQIAQVCEKIFSWGPAQAQWLRELEIVPEERIAVTGSPRFDPYLVEGYVPTNKYLGVTLRGDPVTSSPDHIMETVFQFSGSEFCHGIGVGYPIEAQYEDKIWHIVAATRYLFKTARQFSEHSKTRIVFRPGPWEPCRQYDFMPSRIRSASVETGTLQHEYVRNAFALLDESSSLGIEGFLANVPVISVQALIPRLADHIAGEGGGLFTAPYLECFWRPKSVEEAVDLLLLAEQGKLEASPCQEAFRQYLKECHVWPRTRPSSFQIGDGLLELLDLPPTRKSGIADVNVEEGGDRARRRITVANEKMAESDNKIVSETISGRSVLFYRYVPGSVHLHKLKVFCQHVGSSNRDSWFRYHYCHSQYPHHKALSSTFNSLWRTYETV